MSFFLSTETLNHEVLLCLSRDECTNLIKMIKSRVVDLHTKDLEIGRLTQTPKQISGGESAYGEIYLFDLLIACIKLTVLICFGSRRSGSSLYRCNGGEEVVIREEIEISVKIRSE